MGGRFDNLRSGLTMPSNFGVFSPVSFIVPRGRDTKHSLKRLNRASRKKNEWRIVFILGSFPFQRGPSSGAEWIAADGIELNASNARESESV